MKVRRIALTAAALVPVTAGALFAWGELAPHKVETSVEIAAPADKVYGILTDFQGHSQWDPFMVKAEGRAVKGKTLNIELRDTDGSTMTFKPKVLAADPGRELRWIGRMYVPGIVDGEHYFRIEPAGEGKVRLTQGERFSGALVPVVAGSYLKMADEFAALNNALKARAERA
ncbi:SRPBCC domain-containing protein [Actinomadura barringtoniae]|uniref:SRPBCC domain-containing protein n=1 Tax=Actinomadura barringtoniae TaxID=1427535 RepID=A0A939T2I9_9ACTN|nr:SRPBCC domain-containing protein [Actinomadura barringtoniae]MBO2446678.1 SRPBCC domain-containing protein [Actinomadura barringtoniae]